MRCPLLLHHAALLAAPLLAAALLSARPSAAQEPPRSIDVGRLLEQGKIWLGAPRSGPTPRTERYPQRAGTVETTEAVPTERPPLPRLSMVARDWQGGYGIGGDPLATDLVRPSRSTRMVYGRLRLPLGDFSPFVHGGIGLWRPDREVVPLFLADTENAAQIGAGMQLRIARRGAVGVECDYTMFYRETREPQYIPAPSVLGVFAALHAEF